MDQNDLKRAVAKKALDYIPDECILGVGTGSTINFFIDELISIKDKIIGCVASSNQTELKLKENGFKIINPNQVGTLSLYIDGTDVFDMNKNLIKGGGGALTREKILASNSTKFICLADETKKVKILKDVPLPVEILEYARSFCARELVKLGGTVQLRENFLTDNNNLIIDVYNLTIQEPLMLEQKINNIPGVIENGIFAKRPADIVLNSTQKGIEVI